MKKQCLAAAVASAFLSTSLMAATPSVNKDAMMLRLSDMNGKTEWGLGYARMNGADQWGLAFSSDFYKEDNPIFLEHTQTHLIGATYGISDNWYIVPRVGITYSTWDTIYTDRETKVGATWGVDLLGTYQYLVGGVGIHSVNAVGAVKTQVTLSLGVAF